MVQIQLGLRQLHHHGVQLGDHRVLLQKRRVGVHSEVLGSGIFQGVMEHIVQQLPPLVGGRGHDAVLHAEEPAGGYALAVLGVKPLHALLACGVRPALKAELDGRGSSGIALAACVGLNGPGVLAMFHPDLLVALLGGTLQIAGAVALATVVVAWAPLPGLILVLGHLVDGHRLAHVPPVVDVVYLQLLLAQLHMGKPVLHIPRGPDGVLRVATLPLVASGGSGHDLMDALGDDVVAGGVHVPRKVDLNIILLQDVQKSPALGRPIPGEDKITGVVSNHESPLDRGVLRVLAELGIQKVKLLQP
mmetsp:Transcript_17192/g.37873  ORF Transcript_17192/g.37873 Transcript_17192/m.37873 type:complete len:304 (+) Transcript_17192:532-1443(+)